MPPRPVPHPALFALTLLVASGCSSVNEFFSYGDAIAVGEVRRLTVCNSPDGAARLTPLADVEAVREWQGERGLDLFGDGAAGPALPAGPFVMVEHGTRATGGYGVAVSRQAVAVGGRLTLYATFLAPPENAMRTQMVTSPCVLVALPAGSGFRSFDLVDPTGAVRAQYPARAAEGPATRAAVPAQ